MSKIRILIMATVVFCLFFAGPTALGQNPIEILPDVPVATKPELTVPILTTMVIVSETLPIMNKKIHGILHLLVEIFKLFRRK